MTSSTDAIHRVLTEKIEAQEQKIEGLLKALQEANAKPANHVVRELRARGTILLHVAGDFIGYASDVADSYPAGMGEDLAAMTFDLGTAPLPDEVRDAMRDACDNGLSKW